MTSTMDDFDYLLPANCPNPYYDTWDRHNSIAFSTTKGLRNAPGENNCFLNSAVQVFWHLDVFRRSYRCLTGHVCMGNSCIFCALKVLFTQLQYSDQSSLHPDALRKALAETFANQQRFQLGHMSDAAECFENILRRIHLHIANNFSEDACTAPHCLIHQKFALTVYEQVVCPCGASSNPLTFHEIVHYISASALVSQARLIRESGDVLHPDRFGLLLRSAGAMGDIRDCPGNCGKKVQIRRSLNNCPDVVSIGLVWDSDHPNVQMTTEVARSIGTTIQLPDVFHSVMRDIKTLPKLHLVGLVCYYGKHYSTFVFHSKLRVWVYFDDATVKEIGPHWENVVDKCTRGRYQPLLLLYANPAATPIPVETAPKKRTMAPGFAQTSSLVEDSDSGLDRTRESINSMHSRHSTQRSRTPNPDQVVGDKFAGRRAVTPGPDNSVCRTGSDHHRQPSFLIAVSGKSEKNGHCPRRDSSVSRHSADIPQSQQMVNGFYAGKESQNGEYVYMNGTSRPWDSTQRQGSDSGSQRSDQGDVDDYTLSTRDQYRRPSLNGFESSNFPLTQNLARLPENQRKESFKRGKDRIRADVIRYQVDQTRFPSSPSPEYPSPVPGNESGCGQQTGHSVLTKSVSLGGEDSLSINSDIINPNQHRVVKPKPSAQHTYENIDTFKHSPVQSGLATLPRKKKNRGETEPAMPGGHQEYGREGGVALSRQGSMGNLLGEKHLQKKPIPIPVSIPVPPNMRYSGQQSTSEDSSSPLKHSSSGPFTDGNQLPMQPCHRPPPPPPPTSTQHERQSLSSSRATEKKIKSHKKSSKSSSEKKTSQKNKSDSKGCDTKDSDFVDDKIMYIDRRMVENILKHQGVQRKHSTVSNSSYTSGSSLESESLMSKLLKSKPVDGQKNVLSVEIPFDNMSLCSHRDSGYGSSDRNSSSSTGSGTVDPYTQYFVTRSMIVPKTFNQQAVIDRAQGNLPSTQAFSGKETEEAWGPAGHQKQHVLAYSNANYMEMDTIGDGHSSKENGNRQLHEAIQGRKAMHPIKESSYEDSLKASPRESLDNTHRESGRITPKDWNRPPVPPKNIVQPTTQAIPQSLESQGLHELNKEGVGNEKFLLQCRQAEDLMDQCILAETDGNFQDALHHCDGAVGCLRQAMNLGNISHQSLVYAQRKHNSCVLKARSLQLRMKSKSDGTQSLEVGTPHKKRSSLTSSDSESSCSEQGRLKTFGSRERLIDGQVPEVCANQMNSRNKPVSQTSERTSGGSVSHDRHDSLISHQRQGSASRGDNSQKQVRTDISQRPFNKMTSDQVAKNVSNHSHTDSNTSARSSSSQSSQYTGSHENLADVYGTLPRHKPRRLSEPKTKEAEVYQSFLNKQKSLNLNLQVHHAHSSSGSSTSNSVEGKESDSGSSGPGKMTQAEIRELLEKNYVQRHQQKINHHPYSPSQLQNNQSRGMQSQQQVSQHLGTNKQQMNQQAGVPPQYQGKQQPRAPPQQGAVCSSQSQVTSCYPQPTSNKGVPGLGCQMQNQIPKMEWGEVGKIQRVSASMKNPQIPSDKSAQYNHGSPLARVSTGNRSANPSKPSVPNQSVGSSHRTQSPGYHHGLGHMTMAPGMHMKHSVSSHYLNVEDVRPKPLERSSSQPDCQKLVDSSFPNLPGSFPLASPVRGDLCNSSSASQPDVRSCNTVPNMGVAFGHAVSREQNLSHNEASDTSANPELSQNISVKALASRFETAACVKPQVTHPVTRNNSNASSIVGHRVRSKSESSSKKPKSVLKNKKGKIIRPHKSVTFCENIALIASVEDCPPGYESAVEQDSTGLNVDDRAYFSDDEGRHGHQHVSYSDTEADDIDDSSNSDDSPLPVVGSGLCHLCQKKGVDEGHQFCTKCGFYMNRFKPLC